LLLLLVLLAKLIRTVTCLCANLNHIDLMFIFLLELFHHYLQEMKYWNLPKMSYFNMWLLS